MKVGLAVWGSSLRFKDSQERWSGQSEYSAMVKYLLDCKEVTQVVMIGKHDKFYPDHNKFVPYKENQIKVDVAFVFMSQGASCISTINGYRWVPATKDKPFRRTKVLAMTVNYAEPVTKYLNETKIPWIYLATDPRYIDFPGMNKPADCSNLPMLVLGASKKYGIENWKHIEKYLPIKDSVNIKYISNDLPLTYAPLQKLNLVSLLDITNRPSTKVIRFAIVLNKIMEYTYRTEQAIEWLPEGCQLYGKLEVPGFDNQFVSSEELDTLFRRVKYTLVMPLYDHGYGKYWLTFKPYEMVRLNVVPFLHPDYDNDFMYVPANHFIRVKDKTDLEIKMKLLDSKPERRLELLYELAKLNSTKINLIDYAKKIHNGK